jgi:predicted DCC family thiol-disulfide oxidoreductase YuxK
MIIVFDGVCAFCNAWVSFIAKRDPSGRFHFAAAQSEIGRDLLSSSGYSPHALETMLLLDGSHVYAKSDAFIEILCRLGGVWSAAAVLNAAPKSLRDRVYTAVATRRYRIAGKLDRCSFSTEIRRRVIS